MRVSAAVLFAAFAVAIGANAQSDPGFTGTWKLNPSRSEIRALPSAPDPILRVEQTQANLTIAASVSENASATNFIYPLNGKEEKRPMGNSSASTATKWEGSTLLVNTIVNGPQNYSMMEKWRKSRDGSTLTITRTIVRISGETESVLVYENAARDTVASSASDAPSDRSNASTDQPRRLRVLGSPASSDISAAISATTAAPATSAVSAAKTAPKPEEYVVDSGTRILLRLTNSVNTKRTAPGDKVYLETAAPVFIEGKLVIPRGSYVIGTVTESERAGRVKDKAALNLRFETLTLPNGTTRDFRSRAGSVDTAGNVDRSEGKISGDSNKGGDAKTVGKTTAAGAGIGTIAGGAAGHYGLGAGIGAAAGAAAGLAGILGTRGPDVVLPPGTTMELVLDRELRFTDAELP